MKILLKIWIFILTVICFSCEDKGPLFIICDDCQANEPSRVDLKITLNINDYRMLVTQINIYEGNIEDNILYDSFRATTNDPTFQVPVNRKFTLTATYDIGGVLYTVIDTAYPRVKYDTQSCDNPCYYVYDNDVNLRLKYTE